MEGGGPTRRATAGRDAIWAFRAVDAGDSVRVVGWFDSLEVWRDAGGARLSPDTDGLIGGRYYGMLGAYGGYRTDSIPFIPDEIIPVADLRHPLADLFPPLPLPGVGGAKDSRGQFTRLSDSTSANGDLLRFRLERVDSGPNARTLDDLPSAEIQERGEETGFFSWDPIAGLIGWRRHIVANATIQPPSATQRPVHMRVEQDQRLERLAGRQTRCGSPPTQR